MQATSLLFICFNVYADGVNQGNEDVRALVHHANANENVLYWHRNFRAYDYGGHRYVCDNGYVQVYCVDADVCAMSYLLPQQQGLKRESKLDVSNGRSREKRYTIKLRPIMALLRIKFALVLHQCFVPKLHKARY